MMVFFPYKQRLSHKEIEELIKNLARKYRVPAPEWRIVGKEAKKDRVETPQFGRITTFKTKTVDVSGAFLVASDGTCSIEFYGSPTKETVEHEFKHYVDWLYGILKREKYP